MPPELVASGHNGAVSAPSDPPAAGPDAEGWPPAAAVMARAGSENFTVASRLLPAPARGHLLSIYGFARLTDELGDELAGDRIAALAWLERELDRAFAGTATHPLMVRLGGTLTARGLPRAPFVRLIEANRVDQRVRRYERFDDLLGYCTLSANPVGELVLGALDLATPERIALSDRICSALQLAEHWQDVAEDHRRGRIYLPARDMRHFGVSDEDLAAEHASAAVRSLIAFEVARARALLAQGEPLLNTLRGRVRVALAGYVAGGSAALAAIERADYDVLARAPRAGRLRRVTALLRVLRAGPARGEDARGSAVGSGASVV
jgi:squalene synthase HpnC